MESEEATRFMAALPLFQSCQWRVRMPLPEVEVPGWIILIS